jgi:hypothetical protein
MNNIVIHFTKETDFLNNSKVLCSLNLIPWMLSNQIKSNQMSLLTFGISYNTHTTLVLINLPTNRTYLQIDNTE